MPLGFCSMGKAGNTGLVLTKLSITYYRVSILDEAYKLMLRIGSMVRYFLLVTSADWNLNP